MGRLYSKPKFMFLRGWPLRNPGVEFTVRDYARERFRSHIRAVARHALSDAGGLWDTSHSSEGKVCVASFMTGCAVLPRVYPE